MARLQTSAAIERLLASGTLFEVDQINCMKHALVLKNFFRKKEVTPWVNESKPRQLLFKVAFISVCHQFNWDVMQRAIYRLLLGSDKDIVDNLCAITARDIDMVLSVSPDKSRIRSKERARLLRNIGSVLKESYEGSLDKFYGECNKTTLGNSSFELLFDQFEAYKKDPLKKKTNVLSHELYVERIVEFSDPENMEAAVDYHIMRVYLRTGRVIFKDEAVREFLGGSPNPRGALVRALRRCVAEGVKLTSQYAGLSVADVNFFDWQIGRSVCVDVDPRCDSLSFLKPLSQDVGALCTNGCAYRHECVARNELRSFLKLEEPRYESSAY